MKNLSISLNASHILQGVNSSAPHADSSGDAGSSGDGDFGASSNWKSIALPRRAEPVLVLETAVGNFMYDKRNERVFAGFFSGIQNTYGRRARSVVSFDVFDLSEEEVQLLLDSLYHHSVLLANESASPQLMSAVLVGNLSNIGKNVLSDGGGESDDQGATCSRRWLGAFIPQWIAHEATRGTGGFLKFHTQTSYYNTAGPEHDWNDPNVQDLIVELTLSPGDVSASVDMIGDGGEFEMTSLLEALMLFGFARLTKQSAIDDNDRKTLLDRVCVLSRKSGHTMIPFAGIVELDAPLRFDLLTAICQSEYEGDIHATGFFDVALYNLFKVPAVMAETGDEHVDMMRNALWSMTPKAYMSLAHFHGCVDMIKLVDDAILALVSDAKSKGAQAAGEMSGKIYHTLVANRPFTTLYDAERTPDILERIYNLTLDVVGDKHLATIEKWSDAQLDEQREMYGEIEGNYFGHMSVAYRLAVTTLMLDSGSDVPMPEIAMEIYIP